MNKNTSKLAELNCKEEVLQHRQLLSTIWGQGAPHNCLFPSKAVALLRITKHPRAVLQQQLLRFYVIMEPTYASDSTSYNSVEIYKLGVKL